MRIRKFGGATNFLARGVRFAIGDVLPDRGMEQDVFLQHEAHLFVERLLHDSSRISVPSIFTAPAVGIVKAADQAAMVVLPEPVGPTSAVICPASAFKVTPSEPDDRPRN